MNYNELIESAKKLNPVSKNAAEEYIQKSETLSAKMNEIMLQRTDIETMVGSENIVMMKDNHSNHARFIGSILLDYNPEVFTDTILWVFRAYRSHGFKTSYWAAQLNTWINVLKNNLSDESYSEIFAYYQWMQINIPTFVKLSDEKLDNAGSMH